MRPRWNGASVWRTSETSRRATETAALRLLLERARGRAGRRRSRRGRTADDHLHPFAQIRSGDLCGLSIAETCANADRGQLALRVEIPQGGAVAAAPTTRRAVPGRARGGRTVRRSTA